MKRDLSGEQGTARAHNAQAMSTKEQGSGLSVADILHMLLARKFFIIACMLVCGAIAYIYLKASTPMYEAAASIRLDSGRAGSLGLSDMGGGTVQDGSDIVRTEVAIMQSDQVAIAALNSLTDSEFSGFANVSKSVGKIPADTADLSPQQEGLIGTFKSQLQVKPVAETQLIAISFKDKDPRLAATIANRVVDAYLKQNFDSRFGSVTQIQNWLSTQMNALKSNASDSQRKLAAFQEQHNIISTGSSASGGPDVANTTTDRLRLLNDRLAAAEADRIVKQGQMEAAMTGTPAVLASLFPDPKFQTLQTQQGTLTAQYAQLAAKFGPNYAPLAQMKSQLQAIDAEINGNVRNVQSRLKEEYDAAKTTEDMLRKEYSQQTGKTYALNREQASLSALQSEGNASSQLYNTLQVKLQQAGIDAGLTGINIMRVDIARAPLTPIGPGKATTLSVALTFGLIIGMACVFAVEFLADGLQGAPQLENTTGLTLLGSIPHDTSRGSKSSAHSGVVALQRPKSKEAEAYRLLRNLLLESADGSPLRSLLVTSASQGEGKTTIVANLAVVLAQAGARVLLIDAEFSRPSLHKEFGVENAHGLSDFLQDSSTRDEKFMQPLPALPELVVLTTGQTANLSPDALTNGMRELLKEWEGRFDYVLVKSAPILLVSDGLLLAKWVDGVALIARREVSLLKDLKKASEMLDHINAHIVGAVMNDVPETSNQEGDYDKYATAYAS